MNEISLPNITLEMPTWLSTLLPAADYVLQNDEEKMALAVQLSAENIKRGGGPFGAIVVDLDNNTLISAGVNRVVATCCSIAHAEIMAIVSAQQSLRVFSLAEGGRSTELVTSAEPCAQCFGALHWSGIKRVVCGARSEDVMAVGFDEGVKPKNWVEALRERQIDVKRDVLRAAANEVLLAYKSSGLIVYNGVSDDTY